MNLPQLPLEYFGATAFVVMLLLLIVRMKRKTVDNSPAGLTAGKLMVIVPEHLQSLYSINAYRQKMNVSSSTEETYLCFAALLALAIKEGGREDKIRLSSDVISKIEGAFTVEMIDAWEGFHKKAINRNDCLQKIGAYAAILSEAFDKPRQDADESSFERNKPHHSAAKAMSMELLGSLRLDFIKDCESILSGRIVLARDIIGAAQACYDFR